MSRHQLCAFNFDPHVEGRCFTLHESRGLVALLVGSTWQAPIIGTYVPSTCKRDLGWWGEHWHWSPRLEVA